MINQAAINKTTTNSQTYLEFEDYEWLGGGDTLPAVPGSEDDPGLFYLTTDESYYIAEPEGTWTLFEYPNYRYFINEDIAGTSMKIQWVYDGSDFYRIYTQDSDGNLMVSAVFEEDLDKIPEVEKSRISEDIQRLSVVSSSLENGFLIEKHEIPYFSSIFTFMPGVPFFREDVSSEGIRFRSF